ncbi:MAG: PAS domain-containing protein [Pyrinomonadaceae bacterium]
MNYGEQTAKETDRSEVEYRLRERERFLRTLISNLPGVVYRCRVDEKFTSEFLSDGCLELTGYTAEELTEKRLATWDEIIEPEDRERVRAEARVLMSENAAFGTPSLQISYRIITRDGAMKYVRDRFRLINDAAGKIIALEGFIGDETARTIADERIWETESRYRLLAENMCDLVCLHELDGRYTYVSPSSSSLLGYKPEELIGKSPYELIHPDEVNCVREDMHQPLLKGETDLSADYRMRRKSGEFVWVETMAQIIAGADDKPEQLLTVSRDISKRKTAEKERSDAQEEIARFFFNEQTARQEAEAARHEADRANRAKDEFLQLISHEFRTPLTTIKTLARIMQQHTDVSIAECHEYLETIAAECDRQIDMILNLLDVARIEEGKIDLRSEPVNVNRVLRSCDKIERHAANARQQHFRVDYDESLPSARGDEKAIRRALCSIFENAIKYTSVGGAISVAVKQIERVAETAAPNQIIKEICISVSDTGRGIHPEDIPRLFQKFYRGIKPVPHDHTTDGTPDDAMGRAETPGVGLGLYLSKRLIAELGGRITVESEVGRGSCFKIYLMVWNAETDRLDQVDEYGFDEGERP